MDFWTLFSQHAETAGNNMTAETPRLVGACGDPRICPR